MALDETRPHGGSQGLPWWTWVLPLPILHLSTWASIRFLLAPSLSLFYLTTALGIVLVHWWGPRVLPALFVNALISTELWGVDFRYAAVHALPETITVFGSWLLFRWAGHGECWLPNRRQTVSFLMLGMFVPLTVGAMLARTLAAMRGDLDWSLFWPATWSMWVCALFGAIAVAVPLLMYCSGWVQRHGWAVLARRVAPLRFVAERRRRPNPVGIVLLVLLAVLAASLFLPVRPFWFLYGSIILVTALYYGVNVAVLVTSWTVFVLLVLPALRTDVRGGAWPADTTGIDLGLDLLFLCFVGLIVGRSVSDSEDELENRARSEEQLRESRRRYRDIFATAPVAIWEEDLTEVRDELRALERNGVEDVRGYLERNPDYARRLMSMVKIVDVNEAGVKLYGARDKRQLIGAFDRVIGKEGRATLFDGLVAIVEGKTFFEARVTQVTLSGERIDGLLLESIPPPESATCRVLACVADLTELERSEKERIRLATAIEQSGDGVFITDTAGRILYVNSAFSHITGFPRAEALGKNPRILKSGRHPKAFYKSVWEAITNGEVWAGRFTNRKRDGSLYQAEASISPIRDGADRIVNYVAVQRDVTREVELEVQLRHSQKMEAVGQLAGGISHDFNNLLTAILGNVQLLQEYLGRDRVNPVAVAAGLKEIEGAAVRASSLTRQLLAFSRRQVSRPAVLSPNQILADLDSMLRRIIPESIRFKVSLQDGVGYLRADAGQIEQVVLNLIVNARDAMPDGGELSISTLRVVVGEDETSDGDGPEPGTYVRISVGDTGVGIAAGEIERIFEPFYTTKPVGEGTGLGLSTVHGIVTQAGGRVRVRSRPGEGTVFDADFPAVDGMTRPGGAPQLRASDLGGNETIIVCEDEEGVRDLMHAALQRHGFQVLVADRAQRALDFGATHPGPIHLLLTDVIMPEMNGRELAEAFVRIRPDIRVLFVSGYPDTVIGDRGILDERVELLAKPFTPTSLLLRVRSILDGPEGDGESAPPAP